MPFLLAPSPISLQCSTIPFLLHLGSDLLSEVWLTSMLLVKCYSPVQTQGSILWRSHKGHLGESLRGSDGIPEGQHRPEDTWSSGAWQNWSQEEPGSEIKFSSVAQSCLTLCDPMNCSTSGLPVHQELTESTQTHVHWVGDAIQPSHPLSPPSPPALNLSQQLGLFKWVSSSHQVAKGAM